LTALFEAALVRPDTSLGVFFWFQFLSPGLTLSGDTAKWINLKLFFKFFFISTCTISLSVPGNEVDSLIKREFSFKNGETL
jgi:hypothetical protein